MDCKVAVIGLGYVGLPAALVFAKKYPGTVGFDVDKPKVSELLEGVDRTGEISGDELNSSSLTITSNKDDLRECNFFVIAVPTPVDFHNKPDLSYLVSASQVVGSVMSAGSIVVYESTVYPGMTEEFCGPVLAEVSGLTRGKDFKLGYSPERINPGDKEHTFEKVVKVVAGEDEETLSIVAGMYEGIIEVGVHKASSIKVAEAAKVIENTQRDLNIALMNELAIIFDLMGISTSEVLEAAGTKWNFLRFYPGLVGGHCIGVDPYYLTSVAEQLGYNPQVILAGRRINDGMGKYLAQRTVKLMVNAGMQIKGSKVGILGVTFKENISDTRNSRVPDVVTELEEFGVVPVVHDPHADAAQVEQEFGIRLVDWDEISGLNAMVYAVRHDTYVALGAELLEKINPGGVLVDVKGAFDRGSLRDDVVYWSL